MADVIGSRSGTFITLPDVWRFTVDASDSERDLIIAVRDYVATWQPEELSLLPESCRPGRLTSGEDVADMAYKLSQMHLEFQRDRPRRIALERMMVFFVHASERFAQLAARHRPFTQIDG